MSLKLINHSPDLKKLRDEGHELEIRGGFVLVHHVPYVNAKKEIKYGTLISSLNLVTPDKAALVTPDKAAKPQDHVIHFDGELPCNHDGSQIQGLLLITGSVKYFTLKHSGHVFPENIV